MKKDAQRRLEKLEQVYSAEGSVSAIVVHVVDIEGNRLPVMGWQESMKADPLQVMREPGEGDEELLTRAIEASRAKQHDKRAAPVLLAVVPEETTEERRKQITLRKRRER